MMFLDVENCDAVEGIGSAMVILTMTDYDTGNILSNCSLLVIILPGGALNHHPGNKRYRVEIEKCIINFTANAWTSHW
jgi:hypothetical protein